MIRIKKTSNTSANTPRPLKGWYGRIVYSGTLTKDTVARQCAQNNTVTRADALAVLAAFETEVEYWLKQGYTVSMGDLGSLRLTCAGRLAAVKEEWTIKGNLKKVNVRYTPSVELKEAFNLTAEHVNIKVIG